MFFEEDKLYELVTLHDLIYYYYKTFFKYGKLIPDL